MATPPVFEDELDIGTPPPSIEPEPAGGPLVWLMRILSMLVIPAVAVLFFFSFEFLRDDSVSKVWQVLVAVLVGVGGVWAMYWGMDRTISMFSERTAAAIRPFAFVGPAMVLLAFYLVYPAVNTTILSFQNNRSTAFVGFDNYERIFTESQYLISMRNSVLWVILVPAAAVIIGLAFATLADRLSPVAESISKSLIFLPMAISFVGASVVWTFVFAFRPEGFGQQIGILNALRVAAGADPVSWLSQPVWNNLFLMVILVWLQTGFSMVILSSAIKGVPDVLLEAARIDGATEWKVFWNVVIPTIASTIVVVWTTVLITTWKVFDIVWVMTGGRDGTSVVAQQMVQEFFTNRNNGIGAALAVLLFIAVVPILVINVKRFKAEEAIR
jgi:alpha-glucoside transport system permease protein